MSQTELTAAMTTEWLCDSQTRYQRGEHLLNSARYENVMLLVLNFKEAAVVPWAMAQVP